MEKKKKKIVGYRVVYEDPFDGLRGIIADNLDRKEAFKVANQHQWQIRLNNAFQYYLQIECCYDDGTYFAL